MLTQLIKGKGYKDGYKAGQTNLNDAGQNRKEAIKRSLAQEKLVRSEIMKTFKLSYKRSFKYTLLYVNYFDKGALEAIYE